MDLGLFWQNAQQTSLALGKPNELSLGSSQTQRCSEILLEMLKTGGMFPQKED